MFHNIIVADTDNAFCVLFGLTDFIPELEHLHATEADESRKASLENILTRVRTVHDSLQQHLARINANGPMPEGAIEAARERHGITEPVDADGYLTYSAMRTALLAGIQTEIGGLRLALQLMKADARQE